MAPVSTPAVLLRAHPYGDTSRILRFYTRDHGLVSVMAHGVRSRSGKGGAALDAFASGELTVYLKPQRDLHTLKDFAGARLRRSLAADVMRFAGASALAELVLTHVEEDPHPDVFEALEGGLDLLEGAPQARSGAAALSSAWRLVVAFGFAPELDVCVRCGAMLDPAEVARFDLAAGGTLCAPCGAGSAGPRVGPGARDQLRAMLTGQGIAPVSHPRRHLALLSDFIAFHVAQKPLRSFRFLGDLLPPDPEV